MPPRPSSLAEGAVCLISLLIRPTSPPVESIEQELSFEPEGVRLVMPPGETVPGQLNLPAGTSGDACTGPGLELMIAGTLTMR